MNEPLLKLQNLSIGYFQGRRSRALVAEGLSVSLQAAELVCLLGPNGAGKSTLMRTIAGMQAPLAGHALLLGEDIHSLKARELARRLSVVLTERVSVGILTVFRILAGRGQAEAREVIGRGFPGIVSTDRYAAYHWVDGHRRQLCWAH